MADQSHRATVRARVASPAIHNKAWPISLLAITTLGVGLTNTTTVYVTAPLALALFAAVAFLWALASRRNGAVPWFELGVVYVAATTLYLVYPLLGFLAIGQVYTSGNDDRLAALQPDAAEIGRIGWVYLCHLVAFASAYFVVRDRLPCVQRPLRRPRPTTFIAIVVIYGLIEVFSLSVGLFFDMGARSYAETYLAARRLPLLLSQLFNHLSGVKYALSLMLLAALFHQYRTYRPAIAVWLLLVAVTTVARLGSRTELVLLVMAAAMMYHTMIRPLASRMVLATGVIGLIGFVTFGALRGGSGAADVLTLNPFVRASEFESLFANAVHLARVRDTIGDLPAAFYLADLAAVVPQQLAPFTKVDRGDWYVTTFFPAYAASGGGLAFGTIAEAILTGGWISALAWGAALGVSFAKIHRFYVRHSDMFWVFVFYVWMTTLSYQSFRSSTFALLVLFVYRFLPGVLAVQVLAGVVNYVRRGRQSTAPPLVAEA